MKKLLLAFCICTLLSSCGIEQKGRVVISNESGDIVKDFRLTYNSAQGEKTLIIDELKNNDKVDKKITIANAVWVAGAGTYTASFQIQYSIKSTTFTAANDSDAIISDDGKYYNNEASLCTSKTTLIRIYKTQYKIEKN